MSKANISRATKRNAKAASFGLNSEVKKVMYIVGAVLLLMFIFIMFALTREIQSEVVLPDSLKTATLVKVEFDIKDKGKLLFDLRNDLMPKTTKNFVTKILEGFYTERKFYRADEWMLCAGSPYDKEGLDYNQGFDLETNDTIKFNRYVLGMANNEDTKKSSSSIFFISKAVQSEYNGKYALFGTASNIETENIIDSIKVDDIITSAKILSIDNVPYVDAQKNIDIRAKKNIKN